MTKSEKYKQIIKEELDKVDSTYNVSAIEDAVERIVLVEGDVEVV